MHRDVCGHPNTLADTSSVAAEIIGHDERPGDAELAQPIQLRPLTTLKWPYIPEEPSYPDPLKKDDHKPLQLWQYEKIASSASLREHLDSNPQLKIVLRSLDTMRGQERELALEFLLGVHGSSHEPPNTLPEGIDQITIKQFEALAKIIQGIVTTPNAPTEGLVIERD
ncbi:hypothetical protein SISNIDRAFT_481273 [Sistotremastrum niveocremeum HHB9708]|nr:hypothetical protein SISNIDRAFT_481273 [Sistotremastrum niveocremeum HHB9708]